MTHPTYLVTGATGKTGTAVVTQLLERGVRVRAVVRSRDERSATLERLGAETAVADMFDTDQLFQAMRGTTRAYYCPPWHPQMVASASAFAIAARDAGLEAVVGLTQWLAGPSHPSLHTRQHWLADNILSMIPGIAHVVIAPGFFADSYLMPDILRFAAHLGVFPWPYGDSTNAPPSNEDIARVAVAALLDPHAHAGRAYRPTGPELLSGADMVAMLSRVFDREIRLFPMPMWMLVRAMQVGGWSHFEQLTMREYVREHRRGTFAINAPTSHVFELTGRLPETFETAARRYAALPSLAATLSNRSRTFADFMKIGMRPSANLDRFERNAGYPLPPVPRLAIDDERWMIERDAQWRELPGAMRLDLSAVERASSSSGAAREQVLR